ncbi:MAG: D-glycero-beta-D-manno-heptose 1-phosphate adenylyltransferase [Planctomycetes bacterium]|nr:D-glycero-beta-D-manno-heptose 1-phosphate adenylyltransferase [Planctomycetota bacterium]
MTVAVSSRALIKAFSQIGRPRLAVLGDAILDEYVWGEVARISPEAPVPVLRVSRRENRLGGAGSVVANLARLRAEVHFLSAVGEDAAAEKTRELLRAAGCDPGSLVAVSGRVTTLKARHLGFVQHADRAVQQLIRVDTEDTGPVPWEVSRRLLDRLAALAGSLDAILISDYHKGLLREDFLQQAMRLAGSVPVLVDPARLDNYERYRGSFLICPNRYEASLASSLPCDLPEQCAEAGRKLARQHGFEHVAVTMDRDGIFLCSAGGESQHYATQATVVADVTGAGDMVLSMLGLAVGARISMGEAVQLANLAAGIEIRRLGATPLAREEILAELTYHGHPGAAKLKTLEELLAIARDLRSRGKRIVFTNGCFDLLHVGHHHLLNQARRQGDCLIVAVNSDASIRRLKGPSRPVTAQEERMLMLSSLESVDYVTLFDEDTPMALLEALRPEVLVKGSEYRDGIVVGRELVESYGGRVELVEQLPGISTTEILSKISRCD